MEAVGRFALDESLLIAAIEAYYATARECGCTDEPTAVELHHYYWLTSRAANHVPGPVISPDDFLIALKEYEL